MSGRTELLIFITPRVLDSDRELQDITSEMRQRMRGLKNFEDLPEGLRTEALSPLVTPDQMQLCDARAS